MSNWGVAYFKQILGPTTVTGQSMIANKIYRYPIINKDEDVFEVIPPKAASISRGHDPNFEVIPIVHITSPRSYGFASNFISGGIPHNTYIIVFAYGIIFYDTKEKKWIPIWFENIEGPIDMKNPTFTISTKSNNSFLGVSTTKITKYIFKIDDYLNRSDIENDRATFMKKPMSYNGGKRKTKRRSNRSKKTKKRR